MRKFKVTWINTNIPRLESQYVIAQDIVVATQMLGNFGIFNNALVTSIVEVSIHES